MTTDAVPLPAHTHAETLTGTDRHTGLTVTKVVVWADRSYDLCPRCLEPVPAVVECPVRLNTDSRPGGLVEEVTQIHTCGRWLCVDWDEVTADDVATEAARLAARRQQHITGARQRIEARLRQDLTGALARLAEPLGADETDEDRQREVSTGSETIPGVYYVPGAGWIAWAEPPVTVGDEDSAEMLVVEAGDLPTTPGMARGGR